MSTPQPNPRRERTIGATVQRRVLLVGRSPAVLADTVRLLHDRGFTVEATNRFDDVLAEFDVRQLDLVVFGGQSEEHTSELQSQFHLVCRLLLEKKNNES